MTSESGRLKLRGYQHEMYTRSLQGNVIVQMDTGSGKTHVALLRISHELSRCRKGQVVWFLTPTVELCTQQEQAIITHLPAAKTRLLTGAENVDCWSDQRTWDAALDNVQVIVSTHAILADALRHGFVTMAKLALLVFDEAHHCTRRHPANVIMQDFYHRIKREDNEVSLPHILGLSASLIMRSNLDSLRILESNLDAVSVTPRIHRDELLRHVYRPKCLRLDYSLDVDPPRGSAFAALCQVKSSVNHSETFLRTVRDDKHVFKKGSLQTAIHTFHKRAEYLHKHLGQWASECYIRESIAMLRETAQDREQLHSGIALGSSKRRLLEALTHPDLDGPYDQLPQLHSHTISNKAQALIDYLSSIEKENLNGIIFVEQRVTTTILSRLLSLHPSTAVKFCCAPFVGSSDSAQRRYGLAELFDLKAQREDLARFRRGGVNTMVSTNALEEGIDIQACNLVVCFDPPQNLKSFIQRRGRARRRDSDWCIMTPMDEDTSEDGGRPSQSKTAKSKIDRWQSLEKDLERIVQQERERQQYVAAAEALDEVVDGTLRSRTTTAMLTPDATLQHLHHFCQQLPHEPYVDLRPMFSYEEDEKGRIRGTVTLPSCITATLRQTSSQRVWRTERAADKEAAFDAYRRLYEAGLLNDNLLPRTESRDAADERDGGGEEGPTHQCQPHFNVWAEMAATFDEQRMHRASISVRSLEQPDIPELVLEMLTPCPLPVMPPLKLYWTREETFSISFRNLSSTTVTDAEQLEALQELTLLLHGAAHAEIKAVTVRQIFTLLALKEANESFPQWLSNHRGRVPATTLYLRNETPQGLLKVPIPYRPIYHFVKWVKPSTPDAKTEVECTRLRKRRRYGVPFPTSGSIAAEEDDADVPAARRERFATDECEVDRIPTPYARVGLFLPDIFDHIGDFATAQTLKETILRNVPIHDLQHIVTAISAPCASRLVDYQRYEFVGDTVLKYLVTMHLYSAQPTWHEGFLTVRKAHLVSNGTLAKAALSTGVDRYILTSPPDHRSWTLPTLSTAQVPSKSRSLPLKLLADVVEALIGAAYLSSTPSRPFHSLSSARICLNVFFPSISVSPLPFPMAPSDARDTPPSQYILEAESLIGHTFAHRALLLEALTHGTCLVAGTRAESYQRLEFLGDAVLDLLVVRRFVGRMDMTQGMMTRLRAAMVNNELLGFLCLGIRETGEEKTVVPCGRASFETRGETRTRCLWKYLRFDSRELGAALEATSERYEKEKEGIETLMWEGKRHPWEELLRLGTEKVFSDMIESILGAVLVDTNGDLEACEAFLRKTRLSDYLDRAMEDKITVEHPRNTLHRLAISRKVEYTTEIIDGSYTCRVEMDGATVAVADGCRSKEEAIATVARKGSDKLRAEG